MTITQNTPAPHRPRDHRARALRAPWARTAALSAAAVLTLATAAPAAAHDQLISATPEAGATLEKAPAELSLAFSGNLITGQGISNVATVTDEDGHQWQDGEAQVSGPELSAALCEGMPNGDYEVSYRVVYSDGHSEEKSYDFSLEDPSAPEQAVPEDCGVVNPDAPVSSDTAGDDAGTASTDAAGTSDAAGTATAAPGSPATTAGQGVEPAASAEPTAGEATAEGSQATADSQAAGGSVPGWVWAAGIVGILVVVLAMVLVFRKAKGIDAGSGE